MNDEHASEQARAQYDSIVELLDEGDEDAITENALEVCVRSDWHSPGDGDSNKPSEYYILLCTGGPAVRIIGGLNQYGEPDSATLEYQDWGTPWEPFYPAEESVLLEYSRYFFFGE